MRFLAVILLATAPLFAMAENWGGYQDTSSITDFSKDSLKYSKVFEFGRYQDVAVIVRVDDSASAGFGSDSIVLRYGYQIGWPVTYSGASDSTEIDTLWTPRVPGLLDSIVTDSLGKVASSSNWVDTLSVVDWAMQAARVNPSTYTWGPLIRYWVEGLTDNNASDHLELIIDHQTRLYRPAGRND